jgi:hypothetical protein
VQLLKLIREERVSGVAELSPQMSGHVSVEVKISLSSDILDEISSLYFLSRNFCFLCKMSFSQFSWITVCFHLYVIFIWGVGGF